jgi:uncharacterized membrane protein YsdA (DUF1294 family)
MTRGVRAWRSQAQAAAVGYGALALGLVALALWVPAMLGGTRLSAYLAWLVAASLATLVLYGVDKAQAKRDGLRVPENLLHVMALVGGFPGGFAGRAAFRHKTRKPVFAWVLWISLAIHVGVLLVLLR